MNQIKERIEKILLEKKMCFIATSDSQNVDNAMVAYYSEGFKLFFGSFNDTLKCKHIKVNPQVAVCIENIQIHGIANLIEHDSVEYKDYVRRYLIKFPHYKFYFELENNELYRIDPLVIWYYDSSKGTMHRDKIIIDEKYYLELEPYETPTHFKKRIVPWL